MVSNLDKLRNLFDNENILYSEKIMNNLSRDIICFIHNTYFLIERLYGKTSIYKLDFKESVRDNLERSNYFDLLMLRHRKIKYTYHKFLNFYQIYGKWNKTLKDLKQKIDFGLPKEVIETIRKSYEGGYNEQFKKLDDKNSGILLKNGIWIYNKYLNRIFRMDSEMYDKLVKLMNSHLFRVYTISNKFLALYPEKNLKGKYSNYYIDFKQDLMNEIKGSYPF
jgi:hypothetical protein